MNKREFLDELKSLISSLPSEDVNKYIEYYSEIIDDRIEDGLLEEEAITAVGSAKIIAEQILKDNVVYERVESERKEEKEIKAEIKENKKFDNKKMDTLTIILIIVCSPIWITLLAGAFSIVVGIIASVFSIIVGVWACSIAFIGSSFGTLVGGIFALFNYDIGVGICLIGASIVLLGLAILFYIGSKYLTIYTVYLTKKCIEIVKNKLKKEA